MLGKKWYSESVKLALFEWIVVHEGAYFKRLIGYEIQGYTFKLASSQFNEKNTMGAINYMGLSEFISNWVDPNLGRWLLDKKKNENKRWTITTNVFIEN